MKNKNDLWKLILSLNDHHAEAYKALVGDYDFDDFTLTVDYIAHDTARESARMRVRVPHDVSKFPKDVFSTKSRETGARDYLTRCFDSLSARYAVKNPRMKGGRIFIDRPVQEMLETSAVVVGKTFIEARFSAELPLMKGKVVSPSAVELFMENIPKIVRGSLVFKNIDGGRLADWIETSENADTARSQLAAHNLVAFIADGSILQGKGRHDSRMFDEEVVTFTAPDELAVTLDLPNGGAVRGLGIPAGITLLVGGRFQGKSTLLRALELGVYNHIPGDGRECIVTVPDAVSIRTEPGRSIETVDISPFFGRGSKGINTGNFSTRSASASESMAANIMEALEVGTSLLLLDEDTTAADLISRDVRMQALIPKEDEPSTTLIDILPVLRDDMKISTIIGLSGSGDFFDIADTVIAMKQFKPIAVTARARKIAEKNPTVRIREKPGELISCISGRLPLGTCFEPDKKAKTESQKPPGKMHAQYAGEFIDVSQVSQIVSPSQVRAISRSLALVHRLIGSSDSLRDVVNKVMKRIRTVGLDTLSSRMMGDLAMFRAYELAAAINRMRNLKIK